MLFRRFLRSAGSQSWLAVFLDFLVVVAGIFVGLQATEWQTERRDRAQETDLIDRLHREFEQNRELIAEAIANREEVIDGLLFVADAVERGEVTEAEAESVSEGLSKMRHLPSLRLVIGTYRSAMATGELALLRDAELQAMLANLDSVLDWEREQLAYFRQGMIAHTQDFREFFRVDGVRKDDEGFLEFERHLDFDTLVNDPNHISTVLLCLRQQQVFRNYRRWVEAEVIAIHDRLGELRSERA